MMTCNAPLRKSCNARMDRRADLIATTQAKLGQQHESYDAVRKAQIRTYVTATMLTTKCYTPRF